jgi:CHAD domain-containing protein
MSFRLKRGVPVAKSLQDILASEAREAAKLARHRHKDAVSQVHEIRKQLKRIRTVVRLGRQCLGAKSYDRARLFYGDLAHQLSDARDAQVLVEAYDKIESDGTRNPPHSSSAIRAALVEHRESTEALLGAKMLMARVSEELDGAAPLTRALGDASDGWQSIRSAMRWIHRHGRRELTRAYESPSFENFHTWRKRVKDLHHAAGVLEPLWPAFLKRLATQTHDLGDILGDDHDFTILERFLRQRAQDGGRSRLKPLFQRIADRRRELRARARELGEQLYDDRSDEFVDHLEVLWHAWK